MLVAAAAALLAFPGIANAAVTAKVERRRLTVTGDGSDAITISCDGGGNVAVAAPPSPRRPRATRSRRST